MRLKESAGVRDQGDSAGFLSLLELSVVHAQLQQILSRHVLGSQHAIDALKRKLPAGMKEIGQVRLAETGLSRQQ